MGIEVTLVDAATGAEFGRSVLPPEQLPDDFATATTLSIAGENWHIENAEPPTREQAASHGRLRLVLRRAATEFMDPNKLGFSMSSICGGLPPDAPGSDDESVLVTVFEDFWRDVEFVGPGHDSVIDANFAAIQTVYDDHRQAPGFLQLHVREEPRFPLMRAHLPLSRLAAALGTSGDMHPMTIDGYQGVVADGFALPVGAGLTVYGRAPGGIVEIAALDCAGDASFATEPIAALMADVGLSLVDWRGRLRIDTEPALRAWLRAVPQPLWR